MTWEVIYPVQNTESAVVGDLVWEPGDVVPYASLAGIPKAIYDLPPGDVDEAFDPALLKDRRFGVRRQHVSIARNDRSLKIRPLTLEECEAEVQRQLKAGPRSACPEPGYAWAVSGVPDPEWKDLCGLPTMAVPRKKASTKGVGTPILAPSETPEPEPSPATGSGANVVPGATTEPGGTEV